MAWAQQVPPMGSKEKITSRSDVAPTRLAPRSPGFLFQWHHWPGNPKLPVKPSHPPLIFSSYKWNIWTWSPLRSHTGLRLQVPESFQINTELAKEEKASETQNTEKAGLKNTFFVEQVCNLSGLKHTQPGEMLLEIIHGSRWSTWDGDEGSRQCLPGVPPAHPHPVSTAKRLN